MSRFSDFFRSLFRRADSDSDSNSSSATQIKSGVEPSPNSSAGSAGSVGYGSTTAQIMNGAAALASVGVSAYNGYKQRELTKEANEEAKRQFNENYAQSEYWNNVTQSNFENEAQIRTRDLMSAGLNPLSYSAGGVASISPAQSTTASMSDRSPQIDVSALGTALSAMLELKRIDSDVDIAKMQDSTKNREIDVEEEKNENEDNYRNRALTAEIAHRRAVLDQEQERINETARANKVSEEQQRRMIEETKRSNLQNEVFKALGLQNEQVENARKVLKDNREYEMALAESIRANERLLLDATKANTKHALDCTKLVIDTAGSALSKGWDTVFGKKSVIKAIK